MKLGLRLKQVILFGSLLALKDEWQKVDNSI